MEHTHMCPACGAANLLSHQHCQECELPFYPEPQPWENLKLQELPMRAQSEQTKHSQQRFLAQPQIKPVGLPTRRKVLASLLGSVAILGLGSPVLAQLFQNVQLAFNIRDFPYDRYPDLLSMGFSHDLNLMAMFNVKDNGLLYIWNYQQQRMITLPVSPFNNLVAWSPDNTYLFCQTGRAGNENELDIWDVQARKKIQSVVHNGYTFNGRNYLTYGSSINWSPDASQIALLLVDSFVILDAAQLVPLSTLDVSPQCELFTWSPNSQKVALLVGQETSWSVQIWNVATREMDVEVPFEGTRGEFPSMLVWSPDEARIAALSRGQLQIIHMTEHGNSYLLDEPNDHGIMAWSPDGKYLAVAVSFHSDLETGEGIDAPHPFSIWDVVAQKKIHSFGNATLYDLPYALAWSKDGNHIITISVDYPQANWYWL